MERECIPLIYDISFQAYITKVIVQSTLANGGGGGGACVGVLLVI